MTSRDARFAEIYESHHRQIYAYCRRRLDADEVEDAVADVFVTAWRKIDDVPSDSQTLPWLYGVAYRVLLHQWRSSARRRRLSRRLSSLGVERPAIPEDYIVLNQDSQRVIEATSRLKPIDQEILRLSLWEELRHAEIADVLDLKAEAVRKRLSRALSNLTNEFNSLEKVAGNAVAQKGGAW